MAVNKFLTWAKQFIQMGQSERKKVVSMVLSQIKTVDKPLYDLLTSNQMELIGVMTSTEYLRAEGPNDELNALWVHPHGGPALLYGHKKGHWLVIASPLLRVNDSIINEIPENSKKVSLRGISG